MKTEVAVFGGGCFWCTEAVFKMMRGVISVTPGYAGGKTKNPTYEEVSGGTTGHASTPFLASRLRFLWPMCQKDSIILRGLIGVLCKNARKGTMQGKVWGHAEVIRIEYDPARILYRDLLTVFFGSHDPTTVNRQGADVGTQYRSVIFYTTPEQQKEVKTFIQEMNDSNEAGASVVTEVEPLTKFFEAEGHHKDYFAKNSENAYCQIVINPKLEKVQKQFADLLNK